VKCFYCRKEASAKIGTAEGSLLSAIVPSCLKKFLKVKTWTKDEKYVCKKHYEELRLNGRISNKTKRL